jgi:alkylation response protein AidB-like acyl-CoA dehydrogenase
LPPRWPKGLAQVDLTRRRGRPVGMAYSLSEEHEEIRALVRRIARERIAPTASETDASAEFPEANRRLLAEHDVLALPFAAEFGGTGSDTLSLLIAIEELSAACATTGLILAAQELGALPIKLAGSDEQRRHWLPRLASGEVLPAYCLTEPEAGSDVAAMRTRAREEGDAFVIDGVKRFITNAGVAAYYVVFAKTEPTAAHRGISAFIVEAERQGVSVPRIEHKMGIRGSQTGDVQLDDVLVPGENLIGERGEGFSIAMRVLDRSRPGIAAQALGIAQGALDYALDYISQREAFGQRLIDFQGLEWMAAEMAVEVQAGRELLYSCAPLLDDPEADSEEITLAAAMAKLKCAEVAMEVTTNAVQMLGGYGYIQDYPVERMMRDAKICQIYEGTSQIQKVVIGRALRRRHGVMS